MIGPPERIDTRNLLREMIAHTEKHRKRQIVSVSVVAARQILGELDKAAGKPTDPMAVLVVDARLYLAGQALDGLVTAHEGKGELITVDTIASTAVQYADALLAELAKPVQS